MKKYSRQLLIICAAVFVLLFSTDFAQACSCMSPSLDDAVENSGNIVILKLQSVEKARADEKSYGAYGVKQSRLTVEKVYKGNLKIGQELVFAQGGGADCVWTFEEENTGTEYLFFLSAKPFKNNLWAGFACSRSNSVKGATEDLMYLDALAKVKGKTRLSGRFTQEDKPALEGETGSYQRLAGKNVTIEGNGKNIKLKTDKNGIYEIYDLPPGKYRVTPEKVSGYKFGNDLGNGSVEVEIRAKGLTEQDFEFEIDNSISGKFLDSNGKPLDGVYLDLIPARGNKPEYFYQGDVTEEDGTFAFKEIPRGTYLIVVNEENEISARQPFGTFYYPDKINRAEAAEITIGAGDHFKNLIITAPTTAETVTISGVVMFEGDKPATRENSEYVWVYFYEESEEKKPEDKREAASQATIDENGRFSIRILKGQKGKLISTMSVYNGKYENCPKLDKFIKANGDRFTDIKTPEIAVEAENDLTGIELKFPFPSCKKARIK